MTTQYNINEIAIKNDEWMKMAMHICKRNRNRAENILQEVYLVMCKKEIVHIKTNLNSFMYTCLYNMNYKLYYDDRRKFDVTYQEEDFIEECNIDNIEAETKAFYKFYDKLHNYLKSEYQNDIIQWRMGILKLNIFDGISQKKIAELVDLTPRTVQLAIESIRKFIKNKFSKEYADYLNELEAIRSGYYIIEESNIDYEKYQRGLDPILTKKSKKGRCE